jgi:DNA-binding NarL/FixJ family response regulator
MPAIAIVAASPLLGESVRTMLAGEALWQVMAPVQEVDQVAAGVDAVVAVASDADTAAALLHALAGSVPLVLLGDALPPVKADSEAPLARLPLAASPRQLRAAVHAVLAGLHAWSPQVAAFEELPGEPLTPRELEVLELLAKGLSNRDIAGVLGISAHTAKFHVAQILAKIGAATRAEAVRLSIQSGLIGV